MKSRKKSKIQEEYVLEDDFSTLSSVLIKLPRKLRDELTKVLSRRGSTISDFVIVHAQSYLRMNKQLKLNDLINFGKYAGIQVETVVRTDLEYMEWIRDESNCRDRFDSSVMDLVEDLCAREFGLPDEIPI